LPRINIEDRFWKDDRLIALYDRVGRFKGLGALVFAWKVAQPFWVQGKLVPDHVWRMHGFPDALFDVDLAIRCPEGRLSLDGRFLEGGVYVRGSEEQFAWLLACIEAGKKGGRPS
jgi:hypothetical protein